MKKQIKNLILFLILAFSSNASFCYTLTQTELKNDILSKITPEISSQIAPYSKDFKISITGISQNPIITNETVKPKIEIISQNNNFTQNQYKRIIIKDSKGTIVKAFPINVQTKVYKEVLVASEIIPFEGVINSTNSKLEKREISKLLGKTFSSNQEGLISKRNYQKGSIIISTYTKEKSSMLKNSDIDIVFKSKTLNIKLKGIALKNGSIGEIIPVRSEKYKKTYNAVILSQNEAMVRI